MSTTAAPRPRASLLELPPIREVHAPRRFERLGRRGGAALVLGLMLVIAVVLRTRQLGGQLWFDEAIATGMATHSLGALPGILRAAGSSPLYYVLLHIWIEGFGDRETSVHALSLLISLLAIPAGMWIGWTLGGRRAGIFSAVLFAFSAFLTRYAQEAQPYALMTLLGLLATGGFLHGFVYRRRRWLWLFTGALALMLYTQAAAGLFVFGAAAALALVVWCREDRSGLARDAALSFGGAFVLYLPWLPTTIDQIAHDTSPWHYGPLLGGVVPGGLLGSERVAAALLIGGVVGIVPLLARSVRRTPDAVAVWTLIALPAAALALARISTLVTPGWATRYDAALIPSLLLLGALTCARARVVGVAAIVLCVAFLANPASFAPSNKSNMRDVVGELGPDLHPNDLVVVAQPEQVPLAWYYLPRGLQYASTLGRVRDPATMNWSDAQRRLQDAAPQATLGPLIARLKPGQQLLYVRPLTEGAVNWSEAWPLLVRQRAAQWGAILAGDVATGTLQAVSVAPHNYRSACCVANSAVLYRRTS
jgi:hypothetical protein